jgi:hypothetical protein
MLFCLNSTFAQPSSPTPAQRPSPTPAPTVTEETQEEQFREFLQSKEAKERFNYVMAPGLLLDEAVKRAAAQSQKTLYEVQLGWGVLGFGAIVLLLVVAVVWKVNKGFGPLTFRIFGLTLVITAGLFLIVTGYSQDQIAPMFALLGTIAGFIFGKASSGRDEH